MTVGLWEFCEQFYGERRIELLCLDLQNRYQVNVGLILWLAWLVKIERFIERSDFEQARSMSLTFHETLINPIRSLRKAPQVQSLQCGKAVAGQLLNAEIMLERELLETIEARFSHCLNDNATCETLGLSDYLLACKVPEADAVTQFLYAAAKAC